MQFLTLAGCFCFVCLFFTRTCDNCKKEIQHPSFSFCKIACWYVVNIPHLKQCALLITLILADLANIDMSADIKQYQPPWQFLQQQKQKIITSLLYLK